MAAAAGWPEGPAGDAAGEPQKAASYRRREVSSSWKIIAAMVVLSNYCMVEIIAAAAMVVSS